MASPRRERNITRFSTLVKPAMSIPFLAWILYRIFEIAGVDLIHADEGSLGVIIIDFVHFSSYADLSPL